MNLKMQELVDIHFNNTLFLSNKIENKDYDIFYSNLIDDEYWNMAYLKNNEININEIYKKIETDMKKINRQPLIYITSNILNENLEHQMKNNKLEIAYTDVWMIIENSKNFKNYKSNIEFSVHRVNDELKEKFIQAVMDGFSGDNPDDPYENLSDGYKKALGESFKENNSKYKVLHYLGIFENDSISTATVVYKKDKAIIYNVTTNKKYQKQGVCKQMMSNIIEDLNELGIKTVCVLTEQGFYTEQVYKNMGFKEIMLGKGYMKK